MFDNLKVSPEHRPHLGALLSFLREHKPVERAMNEARDHGIDLNAVLKLIVPIAIDAALGKPFNVDQLVASIVAMWKPKPKPAPVPEPEPTPPAPPVAPAAPPAPEPPAATPIDPLPASEKKPELPVEEAKPAKKK
jgi:outer membrane biosynthesis protein TonB